MVGYAVSIMACITASTLLLTGGIEVFSEDLSYTYMNRYSYIYPVFPFCRINYLLSEACSWHQCMSNINFVPNEIFEEIAALYVSSVVYMILALYLNQVVP